MTSAAVVGSGPNGLSAAIVLARAGLDVTVYEAAPEIGGGTRTAELTVPGLLHDRCAAAHPMAVASPFFRSLDLEAHGLTWAWAEIEASHPLDDGRAGVLWRDLDRTADGLGADGARWRRTFAGLAEHADDLLGEVLGPQVHLPTHPVTLARFGIPALLPASVMARRWQDEPARALFAGLAGHSFQPLTAPLTSGVGLLFGLLGHSRGWPVALGGSAAITRALASCLSDLGGRIETGVRIDELPAADVVMLSTGAEQALSLLGHRAPGRVQRSLRRFRRGPAAFKLDLAVEGAVPWRDEFSARSGTVHLGGTFEQIARAEAATASGRMPERPFVLVCQQHLADPSRSVGDVHPLYAYAHVPYGWRGDASEAILAQLERFAPGVREQIVAMSTQSPAQIEAANANDVGGEITGGANTVRQTLARPRLGPDPYALAPGVWMCSSATAPGGGVHGMAGFHAARRALKFLSRAGTS